MDWSSFLEDPLASPTVRKLLIAVVGLIMLGSGVSHLTGHG